VHWYWGRRYWLLLLRPAASSFEYTTISLSAWTSVAGTPTTALLRRAEKRERGNWIRESLQL